jgi:hypothetical protein
LQDLTSPSFVGQAIAAEIKELGDRKCWVAVPRLMLRNAFNLSIKDKSDSFTGLEANRSLIKAQELLLP